MKLATLAWILLSALPPVQAPEQIAHKRRHLARVVEELATGEPAHLTPSQRAARRRAVEGLRAYAKRGHFPKNTEFPGWEIPYFIDKAGTRCALAQLVDNTGEHGIVHRLAKLDNHAYVAALTEDRELGSWLSRNGLTLQEVAFIQGPGNDRDFPPPPDDDEEPPPPPPPAPPDHETPRADEPASVTPTAPQDAARLRRPRTGRRRTAGRTPGWEQWWAFNRDAYVNLRQRYHDRQSILFASAQRPRRPGSIEFSRTVMSQIMWIAKNDKDTQATALMAWARAGRADERELAVGAIRDYLAHRKQYRDRMLIALGVNRDEGGYDTLVDVMQNLPDGRKALSESGPIAENLRAAAAIALGAMGDRDAIEELVGLLEKNTNGAEDLRAAAITSLGLLQPGAEAVALLTKELARARWPRRVLAAIPAALGRAGASLDPVLEILARFRGSAELRQSCALALGAFGTRCTLPVVEALEASALRDPDALVRRFAAVALGEIALRDRTKIDIEAHDRALRFFVGAQRGLNTQASDRAWHHLGTALFVMRFKQHAPKLLASLGKAARSDKSRDARAAAALAVGLCGGREAPAILARVRGKDAKLRAYVAEAHGLAANAGARESLLEMSLSDSSPTVRYHAVFGLALLGEPAAMHKLLTALPNEKSRSVRAALTRVLGEVGDRMAVEPLAKLAAEGDTATRRRALGALGLIGQQEDRSWTYAFQRGQNYAAATPTLRLVLSLF